MLGLGGVVLMGLVERWRRHGPRRRASQPLHRTTRCTSCGYDLYGTMHADRRACPECGADVSGGQIRWWKLEREG